MDNYHEQILNRGPPQSKGQGSKLEETPILSEQYRRRVPSRGVSVVG